MSKELATPGVQPATLVDITPQPTKTGGKFLIPRFRLLNENADATALLFSDAEKQFLASVPGYTGDAVDPVQLLGRSAQIVVSHNPQPNGKTYANFYLASIEWEQEPPRCPEHEADSKLVLVTAHHTKGQSKGTAYWRVIGQQQIRQQEFFGDSIFAVVEATIRHLLSKAKEKRVQLRVITDLKTLKDKMQDEASAARCHLEFDYGVRLKRWLFRGIRDPYAGARKTAESTSSTMTDLDAELLG